jgi:hypothetical protein
LDGQGQTHLTALIGITQVEQALPLGGNSGHCPGVIFPEQHVDVDIARATFTENGVKIGLK